MRVSQRVECRVFPCLDVKHDCYVVPSVSVRPETISIVMVSEAAPENADDYYYASGKSLFQQTTVQAFNDAGANVSSVKDIVNLGVYLTTAVKCGKTGYGIQADTVRGCSLLLEKELRLFPNAKVLMLMVIPAGSTYRIRGQKYFFLGMRVFPSYLQAGPSFFIEKSKRRMIAEDIAAALRLVA